MRKFLSLVFVFLMALPAYAQDQDPYTHFFSDSFGDFSEELVRAEEEGKKAVMLFFEMDECPFCHYMKTNVLNKPEVQAYFREHFLMFSVDIEGDLEITDFAGNTTTQKDFSFKQNKVRATPVFVFFDLKGEPIARFTGRTRDEAEFILLGEFVAEGHYRDSNFSRYKRSHKKP